MTWQTAILDFWFGLDETQHWRADPALDGEIGRRFGQVWEALRATPAGNFLEETDQALAAVILFDQFPRNLFRGDARAFATDPLARAIARGAINRGFDTKLAPDRRFFLYMPFQHSEDLADQDRSVALFERLGDAEKLAFARQHREVIARFGRFPHRNPVLGRASTPAEAAFGLESAW